MRARPDRVLRLTSALLLLAGCTGPPASRDEASLIHEGETYLDPDSGQPYTGPVHRMGRGDSPYVSAEGAMKDGRPAGLWTEYHPGGELRMIYQFVDGVMDGPVEGFFADGSTWITRTYVRGSAEGTWEQFYDSGALRSRVVYADGVPHGAIEWYREDGRVRVKGRYHRGEPCGYWETEGHDVDYPPCPEGS